MKTYEKIFACLILYVAGIWTGSKIQEEHFNKTLKFQAKIEEIINHEGRILELTLPLQPDNRFDWGVYSFTEKNKGVFYPYQQEIRSKILDKMD